MPDRMPMAALKPFKSGNRIYCKIGLLLVSYSFKIRQGQWRIFEKLLYISVWH